MINIKGKFVCIKIADNTWRHHPSLHEICDISSVSTAGDYVEVFTKNHFRKISYPSQCFISLSDFREGILNEVLNG